MLSSKGCQEKLAVGRSWLVCRSTASVTQSQEGHQWQATPTVPADAETVTALLLDTKVTASCDCSQKLKGACSLEEQLCQTWTAH